MHLRMIEGLCRGDACFRKTCRLRSRVGVERRTFYFAAARPETAADHFMRICLSRNGVGAFSRRRPAARETSHGQIEAAPEKLHGAVLADKARSKLLEDFIHANQNAPEPVRVLRVVRSMLRVLIE